MADVRDGLTVEGEPSGSDPNSEEGFNALLAQQTEGQRQPQPDSQREADASGDEIRQALVSEGDGLPSDIRSGLEVAGADEQGDPSKRALMKAANSLTEALEIQQSQTNAERAEQARHAQASEAWAALEDATSDEEAIEALLELPRESWSEAVQAGLVNDEDIEKAAYVGTKLLSLGEQLHDQEVAQQTAAETARGQEEIVARWAAENGLKQEQAQARLAAVDAFYAGHGEDLSHETDLQAFEDKLRFADSSNLEARKMAITRTAHEAIFNAPDTNVSAGLTQMTDRGHVPVQPRDLPFPEGRIDRVMGRAISRRETAEDVRASVLGGPDYGRDIQRAYEKGTRAKERFEQEQREARARDMSILG